MVVVVKIFLVLGLMAITTESLQLYVMYGNGNEDFSLAIVTRLDTGQVRNQGLIPGRDKTCFFPLFSTASRLPLQPSEPCYK
jgi:hypothetical protein